MSNKDSLYQRFPAGAGEFRFDQRVVDVFPDMIDRSVPGYSLVVPMIGQLARRFAKPDSLVFDLGCSLGASTLAMRRALGSRAVKLVAVDSSAPMVERFEKLLLADGPGAEVEVRLGDIREVDFTGASMAVLNFTLQFVPLEQRLSLVTAIAQALPVGGALVLSEKIRFADPQQQQRQTDWHHDFKRYNGYTDLEISRKRTALEEVLRPETEQAHVQRLKQAGFARVTRWFQCFSFCSYLAEK